jgi:adenylate cyclase
MRRREYRRAPEGLAEPADHCIGVDRAAVKGKVGARFENQGEQEVKNIAEPVRAYRVRPAGTATAKPSPGTGEIGLSQADQPSIAVLPFADMSKDKDSEYFADGLAEELLNVLSRIAGLRVASRTSAFSFKGKNVDIPTIAQKLNVANILEGSVRTSGKKVRITVQLVRVKTDSHLWSNTYDRDLEDIFAVQDDIARTVARELGAALLPDAAREEAKTSKPIVSIFKGAISPIASPAKTELKHSSMRSESVELDPSFALDGLDSPASIRTSRTMDRCCWARLIPKRAPRRNARWNWSRRSRRPRRVRARSAVLRLGLEELERFV